VLRAFFRSRRAGTNGPRSERKRSAAVPAERRSRVNPQDLSIVQLQEDSDCDESAEPTLEELFGSVLHQVTREDLLRGAILVDVSTLAVQAGFNYPVAVSRSVWDAYVAVPPGVTGQDETGRLWDILWMLKIAIRRSAGGDTILFRLLVRNDNGQPRLVQLKALCGPGDDAEPVITILLPDED
jgi:uncharacterized protein DUF6573